MTPVGGWPRPSAQEEQTGDGAVVVDPEQERVRVANQCPLTCP